MATQTLPKPILSTSAEVRFLGEILNDFDPDSFEKATTKYRKPSYQRTLSKPLKWNQSLVDSVLRGLAIGGIVMSKWSKMITNEDGEPDCEVFFNIEDGGTRLGALFTFMNGEFDSDTYGKYDNPDIQTIFMKYKMPIIMIEKAPQRAKRRIKDSTYFEALCENFSLLQEGTPLTASDRYCAVVEDTEHNYTGSPLVNFTIREITRRSEFNAYCLLSDIGPRGNNRKKLAAAVALVSGIMLGPSYASESFFGHLSIINIELTEHMFVRFGHIEKLFFTTIQQCLTTYSKWSGERFTGYFAKTKLFTGLMIADVFKTYPPHKEIRMNEEWRLFSEQFNKRWCSLINTYRRKIAQGGSKKTGDDWLETSVYASLLVGQKRNCKCADLTHRMEAVTTWASQ
tara:strand:- start:364 stop:1557 length:1194 start_codon:yes stop_codon:yes gene_type:complete